MPHARFATHNRRHNGASTTGWSFMERTYLVPRTGADTPAARPSGPPLSRGEKEALRVAVEACWIVDVGSRAADVTVTLAMEMTEDGKVKTDTIRMIGSQGGSGSAVETAFQAARRAVLRCQRGGYNLPKDKYEHWREIEMTFNPEKMRSR